MTRTHVHRSPRLAPLDSDLVEYFRLHRRLNAAHCLKAYEDRDPFDVNPIETLMRRLRRAIGAPA